MAQAEPAAPRTHPRMPPRASRILPGLLALLAGVAVPAARAESLRCNGRILEEGDPRVLVLQHCGEPVARDAYCRPVEVMPPPGAWRRTPWYAGDLPCRWIDEWLYDRGPGELLATVRFEAGRILSITYSQR